MGACPHLFAGRFRVELSPEEARVAATLHRIGKFYVFLRTVRAELFDEAFQAGVGGGVSAAGDGAVAGRAVGDGDRVTGLRSGRRCGSGHDRARGPALAIGAGLSGGDGGAVLARGAGEIPRADDRARSRPEAAGSHGGAGEADRPLRLASRCAPRSIRRRWWARAAWKIRGICWAARCGRW